MDQTIVKQKGLQFVKHLIPIALFFGILTIISAYHFEFFKTYMDFSMLFAVIATLAYLLASNVYFPEPLSFTKKELARVITPLIILLIVNLFI